MYSINQLFYSTLRLKRIITKSIAALQSLLYQYLEKRNDINDHYKKGRCFLCTVKAVINYLLLPFPKLPNTHIF